MKTYVQKNCRSQSGNALLELAIVIPVILILSLTGLELGKGLEVHQALNTLSKELANAMYRDCAPLGNYPGDREMTNRLKLCVQDSVENIAKQSEHVLPGVVLVASVFRKNRSGPFARFRRISVISNGDDLSYAAINLKNIRRTLNEFWVDPGIIPFPRVVTVGEVYYRYSPLLAFYSPFAADGNLYSVTIF